MAASVSQLNTLIPSGGVYEAVDLGLPSGTKWAKFNIGATSETDYGDLFAWGATEPYIVGRDNTNNYSSSKASTIQHDLLPYEDAATILWGSGWRMPTNVQFDELMANTTAEWTAINGINGRKFTASNGNYIFFPAAGRFSYGTLYSRGIYVDAGFGRSSRRRALGGWTSIQVDGMSNPMAATTGSVCGPCVVSSEFTPQEYKEQ